MVNTESTKLEEPLLLAGERMAKLEGQLVICQETLADYTNLAGNAIADLEKVEHQLAECQRQRDAAVEALKELLACHFVDDEVGNNDEKPTGGLLNVPFVSRDKAKVALALCADSDAGQDKAHTVAHI